MKQVDRTQLAFKREADPDGLLNPGKMLAWDQPDSPASTASPTSTNPSTRSTEPLGKCLGSSGRTRRNCKVGGYTLHLAG